MSDKAEIKHTRYRNSILSDGNLIPALTFKILLDLAYVYFIIPVFPDMGFDLNINFVKVIESYTFFLFIYILMPKDSKRVSSFILQIFILMAYVPVLTYYALENKSREWLYITTFFWAFIIILVRSKYVIVIPQIKINLFKNLILFGGIISIISISLIYAFIGFSINFDLTEVYNYRETYVEADIPLSGYIINWTAKILLPFLLLVCIYEKKEKVSFLPLIVTVCLIFLLFSTTGHKSYLFATFLAIVFSWLIRKKNFLSTISSFFSFVIVIGGATYWLTNDSIFGSIFIRRLFITPARISFHYHEFFKGEPIFLSHSIFKRFIDYPYELKPAYLIGSIYFGNQETSSNNGVVSDGFLNFGIIGVVVWALLMVIILKFADAITLNKNKRVIYSLLIISFYAMVNSAFFTTLLTHGLLLALLITYLYPTNKAQMEMVD